jgi:aldose 1-epimerase
MEACPIVTLRSGALELALAPSVGGAIVGFRRNGIPLMRETPEQALHDRLVRQTSSYPLIPYSNRIDQGRFSFEGVTHKLALNFGDHPHSIHGNAWQRPWHVAEASDTRCRLTLLHRPVGEEAEGWPFAYKAEQLFALTSDDLTVTLTIENKDDRAVPAGFGLHPFFPRRPGVRLRFTADGVYQTGPDSLPTESISVPDEWNYSEMRVLGEPHLDNCFNGWDGEAEISFEQDSVRLRMQADPVFGHLVVYVPDGRDFFAIEPVTHVNNAVNRPEISNHGLYVLRPGEQLTGTVKFQVEAIQ